MSRSAYAFVCDDVRVEASGKLIFVGMYSTDITIPTDPFVATQLMVYFRFVGDIGETPKSASFEVTLPGNEPVKFAPPIPDAFFQTPIPPGRTKWHGQQVVVMRPATLRAGHILGKIVHDKGETEVDLPWIVHTPPQPSAAS